MSSRPAEMSRINGPAADRASGAARVWRTTQLLELLGSLYRVLIVVEDAVLMTDVRTHHPCLVEEDGRLGLASAARVDSMITRGEARVVGRRRLREPSPTARMKHEIELLDNARIKQGDKAIWLFLSRAWTPDLVERFGAFDDPWRIRRWRADLRKAARK